MVCGNVTERNLAADASSIVEKMKNSKTKEESRKILTDGLRSLGYDAAVCKSRWEKTPSYPAGTLHLLNLILHPFCLHAITTVDLEFDFHSQQASTSILT